MHILLKELCAILRGKCVICDWLGIVPGRFWLSISEITYKEGATPKKTLLVIALVASRLQLLSVVSHVCL